MRTGILYVGRVVVLYCVPAPWCAGGGVVEVYGDPEMGWYEWRVIRADGCVVRDSRDQGYGVPEIALRDGLVEASACDRAD